MQPLLVSAAITGALLILTLLPLIPELTVIRQASIVSGSLAGVVLVAVHATKRWHAMPDRRGRIVVISGLAMLLGIGGMLLCLALSPVGGFQIACTVRVVRLDEVPTGYSDLAVDRTTYRFSRRCLLDDRPERWYQQSRLVFLVGPRVPDRG